GVHLPVAGHAVGIHNVLEARGELVGPVVGGWSLLCLHAVQDRRHRATHSAPAQCKLDLLEVRDCTPALCDEALLGDVQVEQVQGVVDGFDLAHLHKPVLDVLGRSHQHPVTVVLGLAEHLRNVDIFDPRHHSDGHFSAVGGSLGARVQGGPKSEGHKESVTLQLLSLEEDDEDGLVHLITLKKKRTIATHRDGVLEGSLDGGLAEEHVAPADAPQHALERGQALPQDHAGHKPNHRKARTRRHFARHQMEMHVLKVRSPSMLLLRGVGEGI
ncbi:unnamed protein product, partial [Ixodes persulcatus]